MNDTIQDVIDRLLAASEPEPETPGRLYFRLRDFTRPCIGLTNKEAGLSVVASHEEILWALGADTLIEPTAEKIQAILDYRARKQEAQP